MPRNLKAVEPASEVDKEHALYELASAADTAAWLLTEGWARIVLEAEGHDAAEKEEASRVWSNLTEAFAGHMKAKIAEVGRAWPGWLDSFEAPKAGGRG